MLGVGFLRVWTMSGCSVCGKPSNPVYMCDRDEFDNQYCGECFEKTGCNQEHDEDCATAIRD